MTEYGPDALTLATDAVEVKHLTHTGTIPGVVIDAVAARNGPGVGVLRSIDTGTSLQWRAPDSATFGTAVATPADGTYRLLDGDDENKWVRVTVHVNYLLPQAVSASVQLEDRHNGAMGRDATAEEATAGDSLLYTITMTNQTTTVLTNIVAWLDADTTSFFAIDNQGTSYGEPTTEESGVAFGDLPAGASATLYVLRAIEESTAAQPRLLDVFHLAFTGPV